MISNLVTLKFERTKNNDIAVFQGHYVMAIVSLGYIGDSVILDLIKTLFKDTTITSCKAVATLENKNIFEHYYSIPNYQSNIVQSFMKSSLKEPKQ